MEIRMSSSRTKRSKEVLLNLSNSPNDQKGRALVGHLETDKNLNRGIVISMIKKGWGIDKGMEVHEIPDKNAFLFRFTRQEDFNHVLKGRPWSIQGALLNIQAWDDYMVFQEVSFDWCPFWIQFHGLPHVAFNNENAIIMGNVVGRVMMYESPTTQGRLSRTFIKARVLVNILNPLIPGFWVPRPHRDSIWVTVQYERLQNYYYDCGRIGHEARNCKSLPEHLEDEMTDDRVGKGLGTPHVKTIEESLKAHDEDWDESRILATRRPPAAGRDNNQRLIIDSPKKCNSDNPCRESVRPPLSCALPSHGKGQQIELISAKNQEEIRSKNIPVFTDPISASINSEPSQIGNNQNQGYDAANPLIRCDVLGTTHKDHEGLLNDKIQGEIQIKKVPESTGLTLELLRSLHQSESLQAGAVMAINSVIMAGLEDQEPQPLINVDLSSPKSPPYYRMEFPETEPEESSSLIPHMAVSPISAVTARIQKINLKRPQGPLDDDNRLNPSKKRLLFLEPAHYTPIKYSKPNSHT
ncbi:hypothetical protein QN277_009558 [Acacia crassicarpa]|uniref:CCHC-type domain-containing protein n=1 Tax=Acacia crassicarpa TaxID=499986 RepID=A0AAE1JMD3_9FABA|nr:hypothetical protein QN277_009558 [Acacia crassicarpa]